MVYYDSNLNIEYDESLLIEYISKRHLLDTEQLKHAEIHAQIMPFDTVTTYVVRVHYTRYYGTVLIEGFLDIDTKKFKNFVRNKKINKFIYS